MNRQPLSLRQPTSHFGIASIGVYHPTLALHNEWYESGLTRKFVKHTGIRSRLVSFEDEVQMAIRATESLVMESDCELRDCAAVVFASPSLIPMSIANRYLARSCAKQEQPTRVARRFVDALNEAALGNDVFGTSSVPLRPKRIRGINAFCSGYARGLALIQDTLLPSLRLAVDEFVLLITSSRISRITDFSCSQSGGLFGDLATATILSRSDSRKYPVHFDVVGAQYNKIAVSRPFFDFSSRSNVLVPTADGGRQRIPERVVFSLDGMAIADAAPRAMVDAASQLLQFAGVRREEVETIVPHQAGDGIVRLASMRLEDAGFQAAVINGMTNDLGNVSSCSVPATLKSVWHQLQGYVLCPVAAVGPPGKAEVSQGCVLLHAAPAHPTIAT